MKTLINTTGIAFSDCFPLKQEVTTLDKSLNRSCNSNVGIMKITKVTGKVNLLNTIIT